MRRRQFLLVMSALVLPASAHVGGLDAAEV